MQRDDHKTILDGFKVYAPELLENSDSFNTGAHQEMVQYENFYFWFSARRDFLCFLIKKYFSSVESLCEIGCGGGYVLSGIKQKLPGTKLYGSDIFLNGLKIAQKRNPSAFLFQADILNFPFTEKFDVVCAFDVIEHLDDDVTALKNIYKTTKMGGGVIISVPQHAWLWTNNDEYSCHKRRYTRKVLSQKCEAVGFEVIRRTSFTSLLLPAFIFNCFYNRKATDERNVANQFQISQNLNKIFKSVCKLELFLTSIGINFFLGGSLVYVLRKKRPPHVSKSPI